MPDFPKPSTVDAAIRAARERGDFEELPGQGKPLAPDAIDDLPKDARFEARMMRTLGEVLPEVQLVREIRESRKRLALELGDAERQAVEAALQSKIEELSKILRAQTAEKRRTEPK